MGNVGDAGNVHWDSKNPLEDSGEYYHFNIPGNFPEDSVFLEDFDISSIRKLSWDNLQIVDIATGFLGSICDSSVIRYTVLYHRANNDEIWLNPNVNVN